MQWNSSNIIKFKSHRQLLYLCNWTNKSPIIHVLSSIYMSLLRICYILSSWVLVLLFIISLLHIFQNTLTNTVSTWLVFYNIYEIHSCDQPAVLRIVDTGTYFAALVTAAPLMLHVCSTKYLCQFLLLAEWAITNEKIVSLDTCA